MALFRRLHSLLPPLARGYRWRGQTHYDVLGVHPDATTAQIKTAYLALSRTLHPDLNMSQDEKEAFRTHQKFVRVTQAYSVLSNRQDRRTYDKEVIMKPPTWEKEGGKTGPKSARATEKMSFEERARAMGFKPQDPDFYAKNGNYHRKVAAFCLVWILAGVLVQGAVIMGVFQRHSGVLDLNTRKNNDILMSAKANALQYGTVAEQGQALSKKWAEESLRLETAEFNHKRA